MTSPILQTAPLGLHWPTLDPFLFCAHHDDAYPKGNAAFGPDASLAGRDLGMDFAGKDGWRMYHGDVVPGFPQHPHRGFETVTLVRRGLIDHSDSLGATARFGHGDVQWLTAGKGIVHSEMFPLLSRDQDNPVELFQIWLNLHSRDKMADPHFTMMWADEVPRVHGEGSTITLVTGAYGDTAAPTPPPRSWAARADSDVAIWTIRLEPGAVITLPKAGHASSLRMLYFFVGDKVQVGDDWVRQHQAMVIDAGRALRVQGGAEACELLLLQGRPIAEPVAQHGPFVMNTRDEIRQAIHDYQRTRFGGWPHESDGPVHGSVPERFADRGNGREQPR